MCMVRACSGAQVVLKNMTVKNEGWSVQDVGADDEKVEEELRIRGFSVERRNQLRLRFLRPDVYVVDDTSPAPHPSSKARKAAYDAENPPQKSTYITFSNNYFAGCPKDLTDKG